MVEQVRSVKAESNIEIDTNKWTYKKSFDLENYETFEDFIMAMETWFKSIMEDI